MISSRDFTKVASIAAGSLFLSSDGGAQEEQAPVTGNPATVRSGFVQNAGAEIYYEQTGEGPPIVFAHGLGGNHLSWWQQVPYFSPHYACVTFAHRGFSPSRITSGSVEDGRVEYWGYRRGGAKKPSVVLATWGGHKKAGPLLISTDRRGSADGKPIRIFFSDVAVKVTGSDTWIKAE